MWFIPIFENKFLYISITDEASDFKFVTQLGFAKAHHKISSRRESGRGSWIRKLPKILGFPFNISATVEDDDFKFGVPRPNTKSHSEESGPGPWLEELSEVWGFFLNMAGASNFKIGKQLGFAKAHRKITPTRKRGRDPGLGKLPKILGYP